MKITHFTKSIEKNEFVFLDWFITFCWVLLDCNVSYVTVNGNIDMASVRFLDKRTY